MTLRHAAVLCCAAAAALHAVAAEHLVVIDAMAFAPRVVVARPGDVVTWVNRDLFAHNVTGPAGMRSGDLQPGQSWRYKVPVPAAAPHDAAAAAIGYACTLHPVMTGQVRVVTAPPPAANRRANRPVEQR